MKNNIKTIVVVAGIVALLGGLSYLSVKNKSSVSLNTAVDSHGHSLAANVSVSAAALNNLFGKPAPAFSFADREGKIYSQENLRGKDVVLFFNEGLMCYPACWNQIAAFAQDPRLKDNDIVVLSVVVDSKKDWQQAVEQMPELAQATVVFDAGAAASKKFGVLSTPSSMHPGSLPGHTYVVIDKEGIVRYIFDDPNMAIRNDQLALEISKLNGN